MFRVSMVAVGGVVVGEGLGEPVCRFEARSVGIVFIRWGWSSAGFAVSFNSKNALEHCMQ